MLTKSIPIVGSAFMFAAVASAQPRFLIADRTNDVLWSIRDVDQNGTVNEATEVVRFFSAGSAPGTLGPMNPTSLAVGCDRRIVFGDQINRNLYILRDLNGDGDAMDTGESIVAADATNASGISLAFPTGLAFDSLGLVYVVNAGNAFGNDGVYRCRDIDGDGTYQQAGEITPYVAEGAFGPGNGPYSPQEIFFDGAFMYLRNSSANLHGIFRAVDLNQNGRADDPGEFTLFFGAGNASGITVSAGFPLEPDLFRPGAMYMHQILTGGIDQLIRVQDLNNDGDAQDAGEAVVVWTEETGAGLTIIDIGSRSDGLVYLTDNSGKRVVVLHDMNNDGVFSAGERTTLFTGMTLVGDIRQIADLRVCTADVTNDSGVTIEDLLTYLAVFDQGSLCADVDGDGGVTIEDLLAWLYAFDFGC